MVAPLFEIFPLLPAIEQAALILTPNNRLKNKILESYGHHSLIHGNQIWQAPRVYALADWQRDAWLSLQDAGCVHCHGTLINSHQRELLWQQVIANSSEGAELLNTDKLATQADLAYRNLLLWQLPLSTLDDYSDSDYRLFSRWAHDFEKELERRQLLCAETSYRLLAQAYKDGTLEREPVIFLKGFDDLAPLLNTLLQAATETIKEVPVKPTTGMQVGRLQLPDFDQEVLGAAHWSRQILKRDPAASIGIIVPNLGQCRAQVERCFTSVFEPHYFLPQTPRYTLPFNFSAGIPLASTALIYDTLQLLQLNRNRMELAPLCNLLQSPFFSAVENEYTERTDLVARLRRLGKITLSGTDLRYHCQQVCSEFSATAQARTAGITDAGDSDIPTLAARLQQVETLRRQQPKQQLPGQWADFFLQQLTLLGWPGQRRLDSNEYQQVSQWYQLLEVFSSLDVTGSMLALNAALGQLQGLAASTHFQAQVPSSPIQILGALEGAGLQFTHCWVMGLHQRDWPPAPSPHPLLPIDLQRRHGMPHASSERELAFARSLTASYRQCAEYVVFSSPQREGETPLEPSRLIEDLPLISLPEIKLQTMASANISADGNSHRGEEDTRQDYCDLQGYYRRLLACRQLEWVDCARGPTLDRDRALRGGSGVLRQQAICPFNAFAIYRLGAAAYQAPAPGLSSIERGVVLHDALAFIWAQLKSSRNLQRLTPSQLDELVEQYVRRALAPLQQQRPELLGKHYCELEIERQTKLIGLWLALEGQRGEFDVVATERQEDVAIAGLKLQLRLDRLDRLQSGDYLLIDYKTGNPKIQNWQGERPQEPQLPLYAISGNREVNAIAFAQINAKQCQFLGLGELSDPPAGIVVPGTGRNQDLPGQWNDVLAHWRRLLENLAREFQRGESRVEYLEPGVQRYYTDYEPLNRVREQPQLEQAWANRHWPHPQPGACL